MKVIIATDLDAIEKLKPVAFQWKETCNGRKFGIELVPEKHFSDLAELIEKKNSDLFLLLDEEETVIGYMGIEFFRSPLSDQRMANEHYWYVSATRRGRGSLLLIKAAEEWAKDKGCTHFIVNASNLASNLHDKVCKLYERMSFVKFETSYIKEV